MFTKRYEIIIEADQNKRYFLLDEKYNIIYKTNKLFLFLIKCLAVYFGTSHKKLEMEYKGNIINNEEKNTWQMMFLAIKEKI